MKHGHHSKGFTLVELMVTVAVVAILASIALPAYTSFTRQANRTDATKTMQLAAQSLERCYSQRFTYLNCNVNGAVQISSEAMTTMGSRASATTKRRAFMQDPRLRARKRRDGCGYCTANAAAAVKNPDGFADPAVRVAELVRENRKARAEAGISGRGLGAEQGLRFPGDRPAPVISLV